MILGPVVQTGPQSEITLEQAGEGGKENPGISREMMRLEPEFVEELTEEIAGGEAKSALEMQSENDVLTFFWRRRDLALRRQAAAHLRRDPAGLAKPIDMRLRHLGALPGSSEPEGGGLGVDGDDVLRRRGGGARVGDGGSLRSHRSRSGVQLDVEAA